MQDKNWKNPDTQALFNAVLKLKNTNECERFFRDLMTHSELMEMGTRFRIAQMLDEKIPKSYLEIAKDTHVSTTTVTRVAQWLKGGMGGYRLILDRLKK